MDHSLLWNHAILIDAGSSGSRVHVYEFSGPLNPGELPQVKPASVHDAWTMKIEPGVSSFGDHPQDLAEYLLPLLQFALDTVKTEAASETPLFLMATAGLRLLDDEERNLITSKLCEAIALFPFKFACENVKVISGEMEGVYGWVSANYLMNTLNTASSGTSSGPKTLGFMDLGGASTQITFEVKPESHRTGGILLNLSLDKSNKGLEYHLYSASHLGFGANEARKRYIHTQVANPNFMNAPHAIMDPCLPRGKTFEFPFSTSEFPHLQSQFQEYVEEKVKMLGTPAPTTVAKEENVEPEEAGGTSEAVTNPEVETEDPDQQFAEPSTSQQEKLLTELEQTTENPEKIGEAKKEEQFPSAESEEDKVLEETPPPETLEIEEPPQAAQLPDEPEIPRHQLSAQIDEILPNENALVLGEMLPTEPQIELPEESKLNPPLEESRRQLLAVSEPGEEIYESGKVLDSVSQEKEREEVEENIIGTSEKRDLEKEEDLSAVEPKTHPTVITLEGSGDFQTCLEEIDEHDLLLMRDLPCLSPPCSVNGAHQPEIDHLQLRFVAISEFWYTLFDVHGMHQYDYQEFERASEEFCAIPWSTLMSDHEENKFPHANLQRLEGQCFKAAWLVSLLHKGFGFPLPRNEVSPKIPIFTKEVNGTEISWTLGALLIELTDGMNLRPNHPPQYFKEKANNVNVPSRASLAARGGPQVQPQLLLHAKPEIQVDAKIIGNALSLSDWTAAGQSHDLGKKHHKTAGLLRPWTMGEIASGYFWGCVGLTLALEVLLWLNEKRIRLLRGGGGIDQHRSGRLHLEAHVYKEV